MDPVATVRLQRDSSAPATSYDVHLRLDTDGVAQLACVDMRAPSLRSLFGQMLYRINTAMGGWMTITTAQGEVVYSHGRKP